MKANAPDHLAVTGDLVNLALDREIELARLWLETLGDPHDVSVVPGNHDAYVPGALDKVCRAWGPWMSGDDGQQAGRPPVLPLPARARQRRADRRHLGARHRALHGQRLLPRRPGAPAGAILDETGKRGLFRVVMIHHPPVRNAVPQHKRLFGIGNFQNIVRRHGAELVLHGHSHLAFAALDRRQARQGAGGRRRRGRPGAGRHASRRRSTTCSTSTASPARWRVRLTRRGLTGADDAACRDRGASTLYAADGDRRGQKLTPSAASLSQNSAAVTISPTAAPASTSTRPDRKPRQRDGALPRQRSCTVPATAGEAAPARRRRRSCAGARRCARRCSA